MAATLITSQATGLPHTLQLGEADRRDLAVGAAADALAAAAGPLSGNLRLLCGSWCLRLPELRGLRQLLAERGLELEEIEAEHPETLVAAAALGLLTRPATAARHEQEGPEAEESGLTILRRTLRSGDEVNCQGSLLLLGDVNPGAMVSAVGDVLVWGRLRGVAHAGRGGDASARITALQLRPLQLRIAGAVARGPDDTPPAGLAEQAMLVDGEIRIEPANPLWPLQN